MLYLTNCLCRSFDNRSSHIGLARVIHGVISVRWYARDHLYLDDLYRWSMQNARYRSSQREHPWDIIWAEIFSQLTNEFLRLPPQVNRSSRWLFVPRFVALWLGAKKMKFTCFFAPIPCQYREFGIFVGANVWWCELHMVIQGCYLWYHSCVCLRLFFCVYVNFM